MYKLGFIGAGKYGGKSILEDYFEVEKLVTQTFFVRNSSERVLVEFVNEMDAVFCRNLEETVK